MLHLPDNIKVHFAGAENMTDAKVLKEMGVNYVLFTVVDEVYKKIKNISCVDNYELPKYLCKNMNHVIQDSGLFSILFGKFKNDVNKQLIYKWYDKYVEWTSGHGQPITCVEVDAQSIIGCDETWKLRERIKEDLPNNRIINVWHLQDGKYGLDKMIEYSDYIAIGFPELRKNKLDKYALPLAKYIKNKKKSIDIHLLGCTDFAIIKDFKFCTSCDSITWLSARRFGEIDNCRVDWLDTNKVINMVGEEIYYSVKGKSKESIANTMCTSIEWWKHKTTILLGNQDLKWIYNK